LDVQLKQVGAPLAGLIRSERLNIAGLAGVIVVAIGCVVARLISVGWV
jgi:hypothetical protein